MAPKRPPPLPKTLFEANGPLAPGSAKPSPSPSSVHPNFVIDAHSHSFVPGGGVAENKDMFNLLSPSMPRPPIKTAVQVVLDEEDRIPTPPPSSSGPRPLSIHPTILNFSQPSAPSMTTIVHSAIDLVVPSSAPLMEKEWDLLDAAVLALEGSLGSSALATKLDKIEIGDSTTASEAESGGKGGNIVVSGLLPPPLTDDSTNLTNDPAYELYVGRLAQLSLNPNVYLKALPPAVQTTGEGAWDITNSETEGIEKKELALKKYLVSALESFGSHRIIFGSSPAVPMSTITIADSAALRQASEWYAILRKAVTELGEGAEAVNGIFGATASKVYRLEA